MLANRYFEWGNRVVCNDMKKIEETLLGSRVNWESIENTREEKWKFRKEAGVWERKMQVVMWEVNSERRVKRRKKERRGDEGEGSVESDLFHEVRDANDFWAQRGICRDAPDGDSCSQSVDPAIATCFDFAGTTKCTQCDTEHSWGGRAHKIWAHGGLPLPLCPGMVQAERD